MFAITTSEPIHRPLSDCRLYDVGFGLLHRSERIPRLRHCKNLDLILAVVSNQGDKMGGNGVVEVSFATSLNYLLI